MSRQRIKKTEPIHDLDMTKPIKVDKLTAQLNPEDCYGYEYMPDDKACCMCASKLMCGIIFNNRQNKYVKELDKEKGYLDIVRFDEIVPQDMLTWLQHKPRTGKQFIDKVQAFSECSDRQTCVDWCKSFIIEHGLSYGSDKIIIVP